MIDRASHQRILLQRSHARSLFIPQSTDVGPIYRPTNIANNRTAYSLFFNIVGTIHSHPSPFPIPSDADLELFRKHGRVHIIIANPYNHSSWKAYDYNGEEIKIEIV